MRTASAADIAALTDLINRAFEIERAFIDGDRIDRAETERLLASGAFLVIEQAAQLKGCVYVEASGERGYFGLLSVAPDHQRVGLGRQLITVAEAHCLAAGCRAVDLRIVDLREELFGYYQALGYTPVGREPWPAGKAAELKRPACFIRMRKPLG